ncbi:MAG: TerB family tellurite resistance protein [Bacteroidota bacterium]
MEDKARLYDAFGELLYCVAIADGEVQNEEIEALHDMLRDHPWAKEIEWSFNYESKNDHTLKETFDKAMDVLKFYGPDEEYRQLLELMEEIALTCGRMDRDELDVIDNMKKELLAHFKGFINENSLLQ